MGKSQLTWNAFSRTIAIRPCHERRSPFSWRGRCSIALESDRAALRWHCTTGRERVRGGARFGGYEAGSDAGQVLCGSPWRTPPAGLQLCYLQVINEKIKQVRHGAPRLRDCNWHYTGGQWVFKKFDMAHPACGIATTERCARWRRRRSSLVRPRLRDCN